MGVVSEARILPCFLFESVYKISSTFGKSEGVGNTTRRDAGKPY
jgi:hypothetical protein